MIRMIRTIMFIVLKKERTPLHRISQFYFETPIACGNVSGNLNNGQVSLNRRCSVSDRRSGVVKKTE